MSQLKITSCDICRTEHEEAEHWSNSLEDWGYLRIELFNSKQSLTDKTTKAYDICEKCFKTLIKEGIDKIAEKMIKTLKKA